MSVDTSIREYVGTILYISDGDYDPPAGMSLPKEVRLQLSYCRNEIGALIGEVWCLATTAPQQPGVVGMVFTTAIQDSERLMEAFLIHHQYRPHKMCTFKRD